jgi:hypothetical protein
MDARTDGRSQATLSGSTTRHHRDCGGPFVPVIPMLFEGHLRWAERTPDGWLIHCIPAPNISDLDRLAIDELDTAIVLSVAP